jgi:prepilin-type N-terminal cleavage/methylation domain-containing protein
MRRAFTLLELLLSLTVLAVMTLLIATLWRQASDWSSDAASFDGAMRLPRASELLRSQWAERRTSYSITGKGHSLGITSERLTFVTAMPLLHPASPLVKVELIIEPDPTSSSSFPLKRLRCSETPLIDVASASQPVASDESGRTPAPIRPSSIAAPVARVITLFDGCSQLAWEWFGQAPDPALAATAAFTNPTEPATDTPPDPLPSSAPAPPQWHPVQLDAPPAPEDIRALRLVGTLGKEDVLCIFPAAASR